MIYVFKSQIKEVTVNVQLKFQINANVRKIYEKLKDMWLIEVFI